MPFRCGICTEAYTAIGTEHALCSTKCGHLFGKRCLEKWIREKSEQGRFNCPVCREHLHDSDYHLIYDVPDEVLKITSDDIEDKCRNEDDVMRRCVLGTLKEKHFFIGQDIIGQNYSNYFNIEFFDASNGYILIAGCVSENQDGIRDSHDFSFLKIYEGDHVCYSKNFESSGDITAVALNKCHEDCLEFCVGLENGAIHNTVFFFSKGVRGTPHETISFNENKKINSICYLGHKNVVYSVGDCHLFSMHTDLMTFKKNWIGENKVIELKTITNLKVINDRTLLGIMEDKIYVFKKNSWPYVIYSENNIELYMFEYDSVRNTILIDASELIESDDESSSSYEPSKTILRGIKETFTIGSSGWQTQKYTTYIIEECKVSNGDLPRLFKSSSIVTQRRGESITYTFVPDCINGILRAFLVNEDGIIELLNEEKINYLSNCKGIVSLNKPQFVTSKIMKIPIVIMFEKGFIISDFYTYI
uniref:RING-type domain-containing protein n=1 Tax=Strongyloides papillosus TaxID=174720 RepID=A0A0N5BUJ9_STREA